MGHLDSDDSDDADNAMINYPREVQAEPQFPDRPYNFATITRTQRTHCEQPLQLTNSRIDHTLTLGGTPGDDGSSGSENELSSSSEDDDTPITTTEDATIAHYMYLFPGRTEQQIRRDIADSSGSHYLECQFGYMLRRLCGAYVETAFHSLGDEDRTRVIDCTELSTVFALECWQRAALRGAEGLVTEMEWMGIWFALRREILEETGEWWCYDELLEEVLRRGREGKYSGEIMEEFGFGVEDYMDDASMDDG